MFEAISILTGSNFFIDNLNPRLADKLILVCPICQGTVFPVFSSKIRSHFKHHHNDDIDCELYSRANPGELKEGKIHVSANNQQHQPVISMMLKKHFYSIMFHQTLFHPLGDEGYNHLGNLIYASFGAINLDRLIQEDKTYFILQDETHSKTITLHELSKGVSRCLSQKSNIKTYWDEIIVNSKYTSTQVMSSPILEPEILKFYSSTQKAVSVVMEEQSVDVLQLVVNFLLQSRNQPILNALTLAAYTNMPFPTTENVYKQAKNSFFGLQKPEDLALDEFFVGCVTTGVLTLIASIPWLKFGNHYRLSRESKEFDSLLIPQLGIPCLIVNSL